MLDGGAAAGQVLLLPGLPGCQVLLEPRLPTGPRLPRLPRLPGVVVAQVARLPGVVVARHQVAFAFAVVARPNQPQVAFKLFPTVRHQL